MMNVLIETARMGNISIRRLFGNVIEKITSKEDPGALNWKLISYHDTLCSNFAYAVEEHHT